MPGLTLDPRIELLTKVAGLAGSAIAVSKVLWTYVNDLSFKRKIAKAAADIDSLLPQMAKLKCEPWQQDRTLESYAQHMEEELQCSLKRLADLKAEARRRAARRNEEPRGIRRWLLLYRPEGVDGLTMQGFFYFSVMIALLMLAILPLAGALYGLFLIPIFVVVVAVAAFERSIALRLKRVGNAMRLNHLPNPHDDLKGFHAVFALYSWRDGQWVSRALFYLLFIVAVYVQISWVRNLSTAEIYDRRSWQADTIYTVVALFFAQLFRANALSFRAKAKMFPKSTPAARAVAEAAPTV